jgi:hypothetical protein
MEFRLIISLPLSRTSSALVSERTPATWATATSAAAARHLNVLDALFKESGAIDAFASEFSACQAAEHTARRIKQIARANGSRRHIATL